MTVVRDTAAGLRFLDLLWSEARRQGVIAPPVPQPQKKKREAVISRYAHSR